LGGVQFRVEFRVRFRVPGSGFGVQGSRFRVQVQGSGSGFQLGVPQRFSSFFF
jgi:hypothetical protein